MFEDFRNKADFVSWNAIQTACLRHEQSAELNYHITMCNLLLRACVKILSLKLGNQVRCNNLKIGLVLKKIMTK
ncbi:BnaC03g53970D [Brassica napus]|uniref:(rape) hypothetical protein n=1 Tax=Brassica napus TaxID=3708 RepID=A0A078G875_BRANA|nr:unnamed protein product [Brassica napus]CDY21227.1 BnaC03g53970D [Brassica napus]